MGESVYPVAPPEELDADVRALMIRMAEADLPSIHSCTPGEARELRKVSAELAAAEPQTVGSTSDLTVGSSRILVRKYSPANGSVAGTMVFAHGGGWVMGDLDTHDPLCRALTNATGLTLVAVDYRLSPEHPHPAALNDVWEVVQWASENLDGPLMIGGDSAGGHIATTLSAWARWTKTTIAAQLLIYPVTDLSSFETESYRLYETGYWMGRQDMHWFADHYLPAHLDRTDPDISPILRKDLSGMPPAVVVTAGCDVLRDEGIAYADRLKAAGNAVRHLNYDGVIHGFMAFGGVLAAGRIAIQEVGTAVREALGSGLD